MNHLITRSRRGLRRASNAVTGVLALATLSVMTAGSALADDPPPTLGPVAPPAAVSAPWIRVLNWGFFVMDLVFLVLLIVGITKAATGNIDRKGSVMVMWSLVGLLVINGLGFVTGMFPQISSAIFGK